VLLVDSDLPDNPNDGFKDGTLAVPSKDLKAIFDPVIVQILFLLTQQVDDMKRSRPKSEKTTILLVGGFGSNSYLKQGVDSHFQEAKIIQPPDS
jgi:tRNA A37 threonylcarbamoyltransferase TsaD